MKKALLVLSLGIMLFSSVSSFAATKEVENENVYGKEYFERLEEAYKAIDLAEYDLEYVGKNLTISALLERHTSVDFQEFIGFSGESYNVVNAHFDKNGAVIKSKLAGMLDEDFNLITTFRNEDRSVVFNNLRSESINRRVYDYDEYMSMYDSEFYVSAIPFDGEKFVDNSFQDDAVIIHTREYFDISDPENTFTDRYYYVSVWNGDLLAVNIVNMVHGKEYEGYLLTNFKYDEG